MKTIIAHIPARKLGKNVYAARTDTFIMADNGQWSSPTRGDMQEADVIDVCRRATNWKEIRAEHFPMHGFHS